ncbi:MAG: hypothetical protein RL757_1895 [Bacteroidota bacterium]|jgi:hypothetical protein
MKKQPPPSIKHRFNTLKAIKKKYCFFAIFFYKNLVDL